MIITPCKTLCLISDDTKYNVSPVSHLEICGNTERIIPPAAECCDNESEKNNLKFPKAAEVFTPFCMFYRTAFSIC